MDIIEAGPSALHNHSVSLVAEKVGDPCNGGTLDAILMELVEEQTVVELMTSTAPFHSQMPWEKKEKSCAGKSLLLLLLLSNSPGQCSVSFVNFHIQGSLKHFH